MAVSGGISYAKLARQGIGWASDSQKHDRYLETYAFEQLYDHRLHLSVKGRNVRESRHRGQILAHEIEVSFWQVVQAAKRVQVMVLQLHGSS